MIYIATDHAGLFLKQSVIKHLQSKNIEYMDLGTHDRNRVHYTDFAKKLVIKVQKTGKKGILICGTGIGMSIMANRYKGIRAAVCTNEYMARMTVAHNNANIICLGARVVGDEVANAIVDAFLDSTFEGGRHAERITHYDSINDY